jgi:hypothetical protein
MDKSNPDLIFPTGSWFLIFNQTLIENYSADLDWKVMHQHNLPARTVVANLFNFFNQISIENFQADFGFNFQPDLEWKNFTAIVIAIEIVIRIDPSIIEKNFPDNNWKFPAARPWSAHRRKGAPKRRIPPTSETRVLT